MPPVVQAPIVQKDIALTMEPIVPEAVAAEEVPAAELPVVELPKAAEEVPAVEAVEISVPVPAPVAEEPVQQTVWAEEEKTPVEPFRVVGEVLKTYIVVEHGDKMTLIDKHAAHERMHFDRLSAYKADAPGQMLLVPEVIRLSREDLDLVCENMESFTNLGYELDSFGDDALMLRAVPADIDYADGRACVEELCDNLRSGRAVTYEQVRQELLKTVACKAAIKAGKSSGMAELAVLAEAVLTGKVKYCPHGRPVAVQMTKYEIEKLFKRA
jgi:DNA mismatch repair protein MutL